jgi:hypothetical protein
LSGDLTPADLTLHERLGIPENLLTRTGVRRVADAEARELLSSGHRGDLAGVVYPYGDPTTKQSVTCRVRRDHPEMEDGKPKNKYLSAYGDSKHLFFPPGASELLTDTSVPVVFVEAEKSALALVAAAERARRRILPIATGGCWGWRGRIGKTTDAAGARVDEKGPLPDIGHVSWPGRAVVILFDANAATNEKVQAARRALTQEITGRGARVRIGDVPAEDGINGPDDYVGTHGDEALFALLDNAQEPLPASSRPKESIATRLVSLARLGGIELWHDAQTHEGYVTLPVDDHSESYALRSRGARDWLARLAHQRLGVAANAQGLTDALAVLDGVARFDGAAHPVAVRVAFHEGQVVVDLGGPTWAVLVIGSDGWHVADRSPVRFRRGRGMLPLPNPTSGGSLDALRSLANVESDRDWSLLLGWVVGTWAPAGPYPVLALVGEQGTAKTTTARLLRGLVDPHVVPLRGAVRDFGDLTIATRHQHVLGLDNLSRISAELSDELSRLATGAGTSKRLLYSDDDELVSQVCRPIMLTSIPLVIEGGDLLERSSLVRLPVIPPSRRRPEQELWAEYERLRPALVGALADAVSMALRRKGEVHLDSLPRMADHAIFVTGSESALGWPAGTYLAAYTGQQQDAIEQQIDDDPVASRLRAHLVTGGGTWEGTTSDLLVALTPNPSIPGWPRSPRGLSAQLDRLAPSMRRIGIDIRRRRRPHTRERLVYIGPTVPTVPVTGNAREDRAFYGDGRAQPPPSSAQPSPVFANESGLVARGDDGDDLNAPTIAASGPDPGVGTVASTEDVWLVP